MGAVLYLENKFARAAVVAGVFAVGVADQAARAEQILPATPPTGIAIMDAFYLSIGGAVKVVNLPSYNSRLAFGVTGQPVFSATPTVMTAGVAATVGYVLDMPFGMRPRVQLEGSFLQGTTADSGSLPLSTVRQPYLGFVNFPAAPDSELKTRFESGDVALRFKTDFMLGMVTLSPSVAMIGGGLQERYRLHQPFNQPGFPGIFSEQKDTLTAWHVGGELGLDATVKIGERFSLHGGVTAAAFYQRTQLKSEDCFASVNLNCNFAASSWREGDNNIGFRLGGTLGGTYSWGWGQISLSGFVTWDSHLPGIRNSTFLDRDASRIVTDDKFGYGGMLTVSFPLN